VPTTIASSTRAWTRPARRWALRTLWITLPLTAGTAAAEALDSWADAPRVVAIVLLWLAWGTGVVALLAPRPVGLTALRAIAPAFAVLALAATISGASTGGSASDLAAWGAVVATLLTAVLASDTEIAVAAANGIAYGDEQRFPLRTPPALFLAPLPLARVALVAGIATGPLLLADGRVIAGIVALLVGVPVVAVAARALHSLSRRWVILVPAGVVVLDPLTLADPTLFVRQHVRTLRSAEGSAPPGDASLDLRLGATISSVELVLDGDTDLVRAARGRRGGTTVTATALLVAVARRADLLIEAARRRVRVEAR
jgi:hypothetical protein